MIIPSEKALALHRETPVADLHMDTLLTNYLFGYDVTKRHSNPVPLSPLVNHTDLPRLKEAGIGIAGLGLVTSPLKLYEKKRFFQIKSQMDYLKSLCFHHPDKIRMIDNAKDMGKAIDQGAIAALPGIEGAHAIAGSVDTFDTFNKMGVRYFTLAHFSENEVCNCAKGLNKSKRTGLTDFGRKIVDRINKTKMIMDLAHVEREAFLEAAEMSEKPVIVSHTGVKGVRNNWRNIDDYQLEAVAKTNGVVGIMIAPQFLGGSFFRPITDVADHIMHVIKTVGIEHVGIGTDLDGWIWTMPKYFKDITDLPQITQDLLNRGVKEDDIKKILGENVIRVVNESLV